jgi:hypothetical protein
VPSCGSENGVDFVEDNSVRGDAAVNFGSRDSPLFEDEEGGNREVEAYTIPSMQLIVDIPNSECDLMSLLIFSLVVERPSRASFSVGSWPSTLAS